MLQATFANLIEGQFNSKRSKTKEILTEGDELSSKELNESKKRVFEENINPGFLSTIEEQVQHAKKKEEIKMTLMTEAYDQNKAEKKLAKDMIYFNYLIENFVPEAQMSDFKMILESTLVSFLDLHKECDIKPRMLTESVMNIELSEGQILDTYRNHLNLSIKDNYTKPALSGTLGELYESEFKTLVGKLVEEGVSVDMEAISTYLPFEQTIYEFTESVLIPEATKMKLDKIVEEQSELTDLFENTAEDLIQDIRKKIKALVSIVAPNMFNKAVDSDVDGTKMAGITITVDKNFDSGLGSTNTGTCPGKIDSGDIVDELDAELEATDDDVLNPENEPEEPVEIDSDLEDEIKDAEAASPDEDEDLAGDDEFDDIDINDEEVEDKDDDKDGELVETDIK